MNESLPLQRYRELVEWIKAGRGPYGHQHLMATSLVAVVPLYNELVVLERWRVAVTEALIVDCIYRKEHVSDPELAVRDLCEWEQKMALDPAISVEARQLRDTYKAERDQFYTKLASLLRGGVVSLQLDEKDFAKVKKQWKEVSGSPGRYMPVPSYKATCYGGTVKKTHPYKSTTHEERYFHVCPAVQKFPGIDSPVSHFTVFARFEKDGLMPPRDSLKKGWYGPVGWYAAIAYCSAEDQFSREKGRQVARRKYFNGVLECVQPADPAKGMQWSDAAILPWPKTHIGAA